MRLQLCVRENGDKDAPTIVSSSISPANATRGGIVQLTFASNELVFKAPVLSLTGANLTKREPAANGEQFTYT